MYAFAGQEPKEREEEEEEILEKTPKEEPGKKIHIFIPPFWLHFQNACDTGRGVLFYGALFVTRYGVRPGKRIRYFRSRPNDRGALR